MVAMQEAIQNEIQQEAQDRRDAHNDADPNEMLFENPNHSASAWRPLQRSKKQLHEQSLATTDEVEAVQADNGSGHDHSDDSEEEDAEDDDSDEEDDGEDEEEVDDDEDDDAAAQIAAGRIRKTDKLGNDYWIDAQDEKDVDEDDVSNVTSAVDGLKVNGS